MLTVRADQVHALHQARTADFLSRLKYHLQSIAPHCSDPGLQAQRGLRAAAGFRLTTEADVARFTELTCRCFGAVPEGAFPKPALAVLMTYGLDPAQKLARYQSWTESYAADIR